mgnify:CR=1 FL=1
MQSPDDRPGIPRRAFPVGAEVVPGGVSFRVWAPSRKRVAVILGDDPATTQWFCQRLLESGEPAAFVTDSRERLVFWNSGAERLLGRPLDAAG